MKYFAFLLLIGNVLYPMVIIEGKISKRNIYEWQNLEYAIEFTGDAGSFKAEGLNEKAISDFEVINKSIESETIHKENETIIERYKILYVLKPISKGNLKIPELEARYYEVRGNSLIPKEEPLREYGIRVFGHWFLLVMAAQWLIIILIIFFICRFIRSQYLLNDSKNRLKNKERSEIQND